MGSVLGVSPWKSRAKLWRDKQIDDPKEENEFCSWAAERGIKYEEEALRHALISYSFGGLSPVTVGMVDGGTGSFICCSPDLVLLGGDLEMPYISGIEAKVPLPHNIPKTSETIPAHHIVQVATCICILRADEWHLFYYDPEKKERSQMYKIETVSHEELSNFLEGSAKEFLEMKTEPKRISSDFKQKKLNTLIKLLKITKI